MCLVDPFGDTIYYMDPLRGNYPTELEELMKVNFIYKATIMTNYCVIFSSDLSFIICDCRAFKVFNDLLQRVPNIEKPLWKRVIVSFFFSFQLVKMFKFEVFFYSW